MITGNANLDELAELAPRIVSFIRNDTLFEEVVCFQTTMEMRNQAREAVLPSGLHPTVPAALTMQVWEVGNSPFGEFIMAVCRIGCRSGVRARGFTTRVFASTLAAVDALSSQFGFPAELAGIHFRYGFDGTDARVIYKGIEILSIAALDPVPMGNKDVQYTGTLNLARTPKGLRLVQLEAHHTATQVERLTARLLAFDGEAWGNRLLEPSLVVSSSLSHETINIVPVRFVCKPDELAFTGTESVA
jgi:hypothetical protein